MSYVVGPKRVPKKAYDILFDKDLGRGVPGKWMSPAEAGATKAAAVKKAVNDAFNKMIEGTTKPAHSGQGDKRLKAQAKAIEDYVRKVKKDYLDDEFMEVLRREASRLRQQASADRHK